MSDKHKEQLSTNRAKIVANMNPDDVLNRLQSRKVMNARDVSRIRDKTQIDDQVELLLDTLMRKPDRAFAELINALVDTDQKHVAKLIGSGLLCMIYSVIILGMCQIRFLGTQPEPDFASFQMRYMAGTGVGIR